MITLRALVPVLVLTGCGGAPVPSATPTAGNQVADGSLAGPFARLDDVPELRGDPAEPAPVIVLARAGDAVVVALREVRHGPASSSCLVTVEARAGIYVGKDFLCAADRSDEVVITDAVTVTVAGEIATVRFRTSYQLDGGRPHVEAHVITCALGDRLSCTAPPAIGGYD